MSLNHHLTKINSPRRNKNLTSLTEGLKISSRLLSAVKELLRLSWPGIFRFATMLYIRSNFKKIKEKKDTTSKKKRKKKERNKKRIQLQKKERKNVDKRSLFFYFSNIEKKGKVICWKRKHLGGIWLIVFLLRVFRFKLKIGRGKINQKISSLAWKCFVFLNRFWCFVACYSCCISILREYYH